MKQRYTEIKKILESSGLAQVYNKSEISHEFVEGLEISSNPKENESCLSGEIVLTQKGKLISDIHFNTPNGNDCVDITKLKGVKSLLKAKEEIANMLVKMQNDYNVINELESNILKHDPELLESAKSSMKKKIKP